MGRKECLLDVPVLLSGVSVPALLNSMVSHLPSRNQMLRTGKRSVFRSSKRQQITAQEPYGTSVLLN